MLGAGSAYELEYELDGALDCEFRGAGALFATTGVGAGAALVGFPISVRLQKKKKKTEKNLFANDL